MVVTVTFEDESTKTTTAYTLSGYDKNTVGAQTVTVSYKGFSATFDVTVKEAEKVEIRRMTANRLNTAAQRQATTTTVTMNIFGKRQTELCLTVRR